MLYEVITWYAACEGLIAAWALVLAFGLAPAGGFLLPQELLVRNAADCDSKVVLLASLLRGLYPDLPLGLVLLPDHALLGVAMPSEAGEQTLRLSGHRLLLVEAAGPANLPPGVLSYNFV